MKNGIDVSHFQGHIDWKRVHASGIDFAYLKATQGLGYVDPTFARNRDDARAAGLRVGAYHFMDPLTDGAAQADHFLSVLGSLDDNELAPCVDVEASYARHGGPEGWANLPYNTRVDRLGHYLSVVDPVSQSSVHGRCLIYTSPGWWSGVFRDADFSGHPLWAARYGKSPDLHGTCWHEYLIWQFDDHGTVPGINGPSVDMDHWLGPWRDA